MRGIQRLIVSVHVHLFVICFVAVVAPQPGAGDHGAGHVGRGTVGDLPLGGVQRADFEEVQIVVEQPLAALPAVDRRGGFLNQFFDLCLAGGLPGRQDALQRRVGVDIGGCGGGQAELRAQRQERRIGGGGRESRQGDPELLPPFQVSAHAWVGLGHAGRGGQFGAALEDTQRGQAELILQGVHGGHVGGAGDGDAADNGKQPGGRRDHPHSGRRIHRRGAGGGEQEIPGGSTGSPVADIGKVVGPGVNELQHVVAAVCIGYMQHQGPVAHVAHCQQVHRIVVGGNKFCRVVEQLAGATERIVGGGLTAQQRAAGRELGNFIQVVNERIAVDVRFGGLFYEILRNGASWWGLCGHKPLQ